MNKRSGSEDSIWARERCRHAHTVIRMPLSGPPAALPLVSSQVTSPSSAKRKMSSAHAAPSLEEILQGLGGRSGSCSSKPPPVLFLVIRHHVVTPLKLFEAFAAQLDGEDTSVKRARVLAWSEGWEGSSSSVPGVFHSHMKRPEDFCVAGPHPQWERYVLFRNTRRCVWRLIPLMTEWTYRLLGSIEPVQW